MVFVLILLGYTAQSKISDLEPTLAWVIRILGLGVLPAGTKSDQQAKKHLNVYK
jgi:hypothetical protein